MAFWQTCLAWAVLIPFKNLGQTRSEDRRLLGVKWKLVSLHLKPEVEIQISNRRLLAYQFEISILKGGSREQVLDRLLP